MLAPANIKRKKVLDIIISIILISSLGLATFIVSCSNQDNIISTLDQSSPYHPQVHGEENLFNAAVTGFFQNIGSGAANQIGSDGIGWLFGAMGLTTQSPDYTAQLDSIISLLNEINNSIQQTNSELSEIEHTLQTSQCNYQQSLIYPNITVISNLYNTYQRYVFTADSTHDSIPNADMLSWSNSVLNTTTGIPMALGNIQQNLSVPGGTNAISSCISTTLIHGPQNGTFKEDSVYYAAALNVMYYYYYWETVALGLLSEAYHYIAWVEAGRPGSDSGYSVDSIQLICSDLSNFNVQVNCNAAIQASNNVYNSILTQFQYVGAPYTDGNLLYQKNTSGENFVWVRSLEDYTAQSGASCNYPLNVNNLCGPTAGKFGSTLSYTTYYGTQSFIYPPYYVLNGLVNPTPNTSETVGHYLDSLGFENMDVSPPKVLIADTLVKLTSTGHDFNYYIDTMTVIPYISPGYPPFTVEDSHGSVYKRAIYSELYDFIGYSSGAHATAVAMHYTGWEIQTFFCVPYWNPVLAYWSTTGSGSPSPWAGGSGNNGYILFCQESGEYTIDDVQVFTWNSTSVSPGWSYYSINSSPQNAFFIPVKTDFSGSDGCVSYAGPTGTTVPYKNFTLEGVITKCGADFQDFISVNFPKPQTCNNPIVVCQNY